MRLRLVSNGTTVGTHLEDTETGERVVIQGLHSIEWGVSATTGLADCTLRIEAVEARIDIDKLKNLVVSDR